MNEGMVTENAATEVEVVEEVEAPTDAWDAIIVTTTAADVATELRKLGVIDHADLLARPRDLTKAFARAYRKDIRRLIEIAAREVEEEKNA